MRHVRTDNGTRRVAIIGTGLMGGSLGLALRCLTSDFEVVGFDRDAETLDLAHELGACDEIAPSVADVARGADIIVVAVPVGEHASARCLVDRCAYTASPDRPVAC